MWRENESPLRERLAKLHIHEILSEEANHEISLRELHSQQRQQLQRLDKDLKAFITIFDPPVTRRINRKTPSPLRGITVSIKDNIYLKGYRTTAGSGILKRFVPKFSATVVERLLNAGVSIVGKTNLDEFAFGTTTSTSYYGVCRNPWKRERVSGGSSGGSAVSVSTGMCSASVGTDTGGSIRIPAAFCGLVGYKPTSGVISKRGVIPLSWSLDCIGFITHCVRDATFLASATAGADRLDDSTLGDPISFDAIKPAELRKVRIGLPKNYFFDIIDMDVKTTFRQAIEVLRNAGATIVDVTFDQVKTIRAAQELIVHAEATAYHRRFMKRHLQEYSEDVRYRLRLGMTIPAASYLEAQRARRKLLSDFRHLFSSVDVLATPTAVIQPPKIGEMSMTIDGKRHDVRDLLLRPTQPISLMCVPAISLPCGLTPQGMPVGLQLVSDLLDDRKLLEYSLAVEKVLKFEQCTPS